MTKIVNGRELPYPLARLHTEANITITNLTVDNDIDANGAVAVVGDGFGTLIKRLVDTDIIQGSTS